MTTRWNFWKKEVHYVQRRDIDPAMVQRAADLIMKKEKPFIIAGGGVGYSDAAAELIEFTREV